MQDRGHLLTELRNERSMQIDRMSVAEGFDVVNSEDATIPAAVAAAKPSIVAAIELVVAAFRAGGRLIYVGAGTSGRLAVVDASECPPTFLTPPEMVQGIIAGGQGAMFKAVEGAEDSSEAGGQAIADKEVGPRDVVFGIATGGTTPYVHGAIAEGRKRGAKTVFFACVSKEEVPDHADVSIRVLTGPEVITGSTRMKAGTATKLALNTISTTLMVRAGRVYENLMVDLRATNDKLRDRAARIVATLTGLGRDGSLALLDRAGGSVKTAVVMHRLGLARDTAERRLAEGAGRLDRALGEGSPPP